jgi:oxygen-independent coproporphyrinogen-3 oxidase
VITSSASDPEWRRCSASSLALYVHVPFCRARCAYCDFNTYAGLDDLIPAYVEALCREIRMAGRRWGSSSVATLYIGGGTPSLLPIDAVSDILEAVRVAFGLAASGEASLEVNPGTVTAGYLSALRVQGLDRLSIGVQSAEDEVLVALGRIHTWDDAVRTVRWAREAGFKNLNLDLLFGLPGQTVEGWRAKLERVLDLAPDHLSLYGLTVEKGTPLARRIARQAVLPPDEDLTAAMYELAEEVLANSGFFHYEISNWARTLRPARFSGDHWWPEFAETDEGTETSEEVSPYVSRHNLTYWRNEPWLGVGAGAHSWMPRDLWSDPSTASAGRRWSNPQHPEDYVTAVREGSYPLSCCPDVEEIDRELAMGETMMLGLRLAEGVRAATFAARFDAELEDVFGEQLTALCRLGLISWDGVVARLTARGRLIGNRVFERFI